MDCDADAETGTVQFAVSDEEDDRKEFTMPDFMKEDFKRFEKDEGYEPKVVKVITLVAMGDEQIIDATYE